MITDASYDQLRDGAIQNDYSNTLNDLTLGIYNVFGVPLEDATKFNELFEDSRNFTPSQNSWESKLCTQEYQKYVPKMILKCVRFINDYGLKEEGLYRVSGSGQEVKELKNAFVQHGPSYDIPPTTDVHAVTSLIKTFVRELPHDLLPVKRHKFLAYTKANVPTELAFSKGISNFSIFTEEEENLNPIVIPTQILQEILQGLTPHQFALLQTLTRHFASIIQFSQYNRMNLASLSVILCPTLKIHKSVFHALILKPMVWANLHPKESDLYVRSVKYDHRNILSYRQDEGDSNNESSVAGTAPSSSNTSVADVPVITLQPNSSEQHILDPISFNLFNSSKLLEKNDSRGSFLFRADDEHVDEYFDNGVISFSNPLDLAGVHPESIIPSTYSSLSSFSDSSSHNSRNSDNSEYSDILKHPPPQFSTKHEYRYKQPEVNATGNLPKMKLPARSLPKSASNRKLFLRSPSVGHFNI